MGIFMQFFLFGIYNFSHDVVTYGLDETHIINKNNFSNAQCFIIVMSMPIRGQYLFTYLVHHVHCQQHAGIAKTLQTT